MKGRTRSKELPPPSPGEADWWATVHVKFVPPIADPDDPSATPTQGYYRNFGVRAAPARVHLVISAAVKDGVIEWSDTEWNLLDANDLKSHMRAQITPVAGEGVWYEGGRCLYADPDLEPTPS
jgi:hypothetical protein